MSEKVIWARRSTFILAAAGSAIGLGNLWKFPYMVGENGGGAFVLIYLLCVLLIGLPVMMSETIIGKYAHGNAIDAMSETARRSGASQWWKATAALGMLVIFIILSFYSVIAGWAVDYTWHFMAGTFNGRDVADVEQFFNHLLSDPKRLIIWHTLFMLITALIIARGAKAGIEKSLGVMMPLLFVLLLGIVGYSLVATGKFSMTLDYMFSPDFSKITPIVVINALGQAFFSLSLGMCVIMTYAAYMRKDLSITESSLYITGIDTVMALLAGLAIFPIVFANEMSAGSGPGLLFVSLSTAFAQLGTVGAALGVAFFFLVIIAALSSSISLVEPFVKWFEERFQTGRILITFIYCFIVWLLGLVSVFSFNIWSDVNVLGTGKTPFDLLDFVTSSIMLPVNALLISIYVGWVMNTSISKEQLFKLNHCTFSIWLLVMRYIAPLLIALVFVSSVLGEEKTTHLIDLLFAW